MKEEIEDGCSKTKTYTYVYDNEDIILEILAKTEGNKEKTEITRYIHGPGIDEPLAIEQKGKVYFYHTDGLGSIVSLTDSKGKVVQTYEYDSFGNLHDQKNRIKQPYTYTGREWDKEIGLYFYRARYYDPTIGRFISEDPIGFAGGDVNLYSYVLNNPVNFIDPLGLYWFRQSWQSPGVVGRPGTPVPPRGTVSELIEQHVPAGYTFGEMHDTFVDIATSAGLPDWLINIPSMPSVYNIALTVEMLRSLGIFEQPSPPEQVTPCGGRGASGSW